MIWLLNSQGMENCESTESFCLSILTIYTNDWSSFWHVYCCHVCFFFFEIPKYVQAKNRLGYLDWHFMEWASMISKLTGYDECRLARFHPIRNFFANEIYQRLSHFFSLVLVICSSWYLHFRLSYEFLTFIYIYHLTFGDKSVRVFRFSHLELLTSYFGSQMVFPNI